MQKPNHSPILSSSLPSSWDILSTLFYAILDIMCFIHTGGVWGKGKPAFILNYKSTIPAKSSGMNHFHSIFIDFNPRF